MTVYNHGQKLYGQLRKTALSLTPQQCTTNLKDHLQGV